MKEYVIAEKSELTDIANAIREKTGKNQLMTIQDLVKIINNFELGAPYEYGTYNQTYLLQGGFVVEPDGVFVTGAYNQTLLQKGFISNIEEPYIYGAFELQEEKI